MRIILFIVVMFNFICSSTEILENKYLKISVSKDGTLGDGNKPPGIQFDREGRGNFNNDIDYLTPKIPYEYYSFKHNNNLYFSNNAKNNNKKIISGLKNFSINQNSETITTTIFTIDNKFKIEHNYSLKDREIRITTKITNLTEDVLQDIYFARGLDPDIDYGKYKNMDTINSRGFNGNDKKDFVYTESSITSSPIGLYSSSEISHNTSVFKFADIRYINMDAQTIYNGVYSGIGTMDSIINIAFKIDTLQPAETKDINYSYICSGDIAKVIKIESLVDIYSDKNIFPITYTENDNYEIIHEIPSFKINSKDISSIKFPISIDNIPQGIKININGNIFNTKNSTGTISLNCNEIYNVKILRNKDFKENKKFNIKFKAGKVEGNIAQWLGDSNEFTLRFKPKMPKGGIKISTKTIKIPYKWMNGYEEVATTAQFTLENENKTTDNNISIELKDIPSGIKIEIEGKEFTKESPKINSILINSYKPCSIKIYRDKNFKEKNEFKINFHVESNNKLRLNRKDFSYTFKPIPRNLILKTSTDRLTMPLNRLDKKILFTVYDGSRKIVDKELKELILTNNLKLDNYKIETKKDYIELKFIPQKSFCFPPHINIGENSVSFTITTPYPNESEIKNIKIEIVDIPFWEKWKCLILLSLGLLFLLIFIYGYLRKNRFCKNSHFRIEREGRRASTSYLKSKVSFVSKLIPFKDEKVSIDGITFIAGGGCMVIIPKNSQSRQLNIDGEKLEDMAGKKDITMVGGMEIFKRNRVMRFHS